MAFDPGEYTVVEVLAYVEEHPEEINDVYQAEVSGKNRSTLMLQLEQRMNQATQPPPEEPPPPAADLPPEATTPPSGIVTPPSLGSQELLEEASGGPEPTPRLGVTVTVDEMTATAGIEGLTGTTPAELDWGDGTMVEVSPETTEETHDYAEPGVFFVSVTTEGQRAATTARVGDPESAQLPANAQDYHGMVRGSDDPYAHLRVQQAALGR